MRSIKPKLAAAMQMQRAAIINVLWRFAPASTLIFGPSIECLRFGDAPSWTMMLTIARPTHFRPREEARSVSGTDRPTHELDQGAKNQLCCHEVQMATSGVLEECDIGWRLPAGDTAANEVIQIPKDILLFNYTMRDGESDVAYAVEGRFTAIDKD